MTVEFISAINVNPSNEINKLGRVDIDVAYLKRYSRILEDGGFDYTLVPYGSSFHDPFRIASAVTQFTERIKPIIALRPNTIYPTVAAKALATLDQARAHQIHKHRPGTNREKLDHEHAPSNRALQRPLDFAAGTTRRSGDLA